MRNIDGNNDIVGFRFHPTNKELVDHYLWNKIHGHDSLVHAINEVDDLFFKDPWELSGWSKIKSTDQEWYFFSRRGYKKRVNRLTDNGFWKGTGKPRNVKGENGSAVKKTLVFYEGRTPNAKWTPWVIHEYTFTSAAVDNKDGIFLCILKNKGEKANISHSESCQTSEEANISPSESCQTSEDANITPSGSFQPSEVAEEANIPSTESCQPTEVAEEEIPDNLNMPNLDEVLSLFKEPDGMHELELKLLMHNHWQPSCEKVTHMCDFSRSHDRIPNLYNSEKHDDESWLGYLADDYVPCPNERSSEQHLGNEGCDLPSVDLSMTFSEESSRKRPRFEDGVLCGGIKVEECQPMVISGLMMLDEHADSMKSQALAMFSAPNVTFTCCKA